RQLGVEAKRMSEPALQFLSRLELPGNVRQLENLCNWITVMAPGQTVEIKDLPPELLQGPGGDGAGAGSQPVPSWALAPATQEGAVQEGAAAVQTDGQTERQGAAAASAGPSWTSLLESEANQLLSAGQPEVMDALGRQFES